MIHCYRNVAVGPVARWFVAQGPAALGPGAPSLGVQRRKAQAKAQGSLVRRVSMLGLVWLALVPWASASGTGSAPAPVPSPAQPSPATVPGAPRPDPNSAQAGLTVHAGVAGVPVVNIVAPNASGLSHNQFLDYHVSPQGLVLNNAAQVAGVSQLLGPLAANPNLDHSPPARLILNEVMGPDGSLLQGATEVFGASADLILANPHGIHCAGCSFFNSAHATLTTAVPQTDAHGALIGWGPRTADIHIDTSGLDARALAQVHLDARQVQIHGPVTAQSVYVQADTLHHAARVVAAGDIVIALVQDYEGGGSLDAAHALQLTSQKGSLFVEASEGRQALLRGGDLRLRAAQDIALRGAHIEGLQRNASPGHVHIQAGGNLRLTALATADKPASAPSGTEPTAAGNFILQRTVLIPTQLHADGNMALRAGGDLLLSASDAQAKGALSLEATSLRVRADWAEEHRLRLTQQGSAALAPCPWNICLQPPSAMTRMDSERTHLVTARASNLRSGQALQLRARDRILLQGAQLDAGSDMELVAGGGRGEHAPNAQPSLELLPAMQERRRVSHTQTNTRQPRADASGLVLQSLQTRTEEQVESEALATRLRSKGAMSLQSDGMVALDGASLSAAAQLDLQAADAVRMGATAQRTRSQHATSTQSLVLGAPQLQGGELALEWGLSRGESQTRTERLTYLPSTLNAALGMRVSSRGDMTLHGAQLRTPGPLALYAKGTVGISAPKGAERSEARESTSFDGLRVALSTPTLQAAGKAWDSAVAADRDNQASDTASYYGDVHRATEKIETLATELGKVRDAVHTPSAQNLAKVRLLSLFAGGVARVESQTTDAHSETLYPASLESHDLQISAGQDLALAAAKLNSTGVLQLRAGRHLRLEPALTQVQNTGDTRSAERTVGARAALDAAGKGHIVEGVLRTKSSQAHSSSDTQEAVGSQLNASQLKLSAGGQLSANAVHGDAQDVTLHAGAQLRIGAAEMTATSSKSAHTDSASYTLGLGADGRPNALSVELSVKNSLARSIEQKHGPSRFIARHQLALRSGDDMVLQGGVLAAAQQNIVSGKDLHVCSVQDLRTAQQQQLRRDFGVGVSADPWVSGLQEQSHERASAQWVPVQTALQSSGSMDISVRGTTQIVGAKVVSDSGALTLRSAALQASDLQDESRRQGSMNNLGLGLSFPDQKPPQRKGFPEFALGATWDQQQQWDRATIGSGAVILDPGAQLPSGLNRDPAQAQLAPRPTHGAGSIGF